MPRASLALLWNLFQFQLGWFALVLAVAAGIPWLGLAVVALLIVIHLGWFARPGEGTLLLVLGLGGWVWESLLHSLGFVAYPGHVQSVAAPLWMAALWVNFAATLNHALAWLQGRPGLAALLGAVGGPLAFVAGDGLDAVSLLHPLFSLCVLALAWAGLTPLSLALAARLRGAGPGGIAEVEA